MRNEQLSRAGAAPDLDGALAAIRDPRGAEGDELGTTSRHPVVRV